MDPVAAWCARLTRCRTAELRSDDDMVIALPLELYPKTDEVSYLCGEKVTVSNDATGAS